MQMKIRSNHGVTAITNNTIHDLTIANRCKNINNSSIMGIRQDQSSGLYAKTVIGNTIYNLSNTNAAYTGEVSGLHFAGGDVAANNVVAGNFIHSLSMTGTGSVTGVAFEGGAVNFYNNIITLGGNPTSVVTGVNETANMMTYASTVYFNTISIFGTATDGESNCYRSTNPAPAAVHTYKNNVFANTRTGGGSNFGIQIILGALNNIVLDYNNYWVSAGNSNLGRFNNTTVSQLDATWRTNSGGDVNSVSVDPLFVNTGTTVAADYKRTMSTPGLTIAGITTDYTAVTSRHATHPSMGAWETLNCWKGSSSNVWNLAANWAGGFAPAPTENVEFSTVSNNGIVAASDLVVAGDLTINNLVNLTTRTLTIPTTTSLTVTGTITTDNNPNRILIKSAADVANGSLIFHNTQDNPVAATVEMYSKAFKDIARVNNKWQYIGIPLRSLVAQPTLNGGVVRRWDEPSYKWVLQTNADVLTSFTGYEITQPAPKTYIFQGNLENNSLTDMALTYHGAVPADAGWNLIGNPYTAAIDISKISFGTETQATVILYNTGSPANWTAAGGTGGDGAGQYLSVPKNTIEPLLPTQIPSMQAFFVVAKSASASATISIPYSAVGTVVKNTTLQRSTAAEQVCTRIDVKGANFTDRMWIFTHPSCSHTFDNGWDGIKSFGTALAPQLYAMEPDGDYQVNTVDDINNTPLGFQAGIDANYTLTFTHQNVETRYNALYLVDLLTNKTTDITQSGTAYNFAANTSAAPTNRFKIVTSTGITTQTATMESGMIKVLSTQKMLLVHNQTAANGNLTVSDMNGRSMLQSTFLPNSITTLPTNLLEGWYVVKLKTENNEIIYEKILIRQ